MQWFQAIKSWFWIGIALCVPSGVGVWGLLQLLNLPELPDCVSQLSLDDTGAIFYCATTIADEQDAMKLYKAIEFVNTLPVNHPQRAMGDRLIEQWSQAILRLGENAFQQGDLNKAIDTVKLIPVNVTTHKLAQNRTKQWQSIWSKAEAIYESAAAKMDAQMDDNNGENSALAFIKAQQLLNLGNDYWGTTKYQELVEQIQDIKEKIEASKKLEEDYRKAETTQKPEIINESDQEQETEDLAQLQKARTLASSKKIDDLRDAITEASMVVSDRYYPEAQKLIATTNRKIEIADERSYLQQAKELASKNDAISLEMAINQAGLIAKESPLYKEANQHITNWNVRMLKLHQTEAKQKKVLGQKKPLDNSVFKDSSGDNSLDTNLQNVELPAANSEKIFQQEDEYLQNIKAE